MKAYWDSSALVAASADLTLRTRLRDERGFVRSHALAEIFSALTGGNLTIRLEADAAARTVENLAQDLDFIELTPHEILGALKQARKRGVRGDVCMISCTLWPRRNPGAMSSLQRMKTILSH